MNKKKYLKEYFGHDSFRPGQEKVIDTILSGRDIICIMPTGSGKSLCYEFPALLFPGITLVISPLISLMENQVLSLERKNIRAAYINSTLSKDRIRSVYDDMRSDRIKILYISPERLFLENFLKASEDLTVSFICIDEAHLITSWGENFRPSYRKIYDYISQRKDTRPVIAAFSATATYHVIEDIKNSLSLNDPLIVNNGYDRKDLIYKIIRCNDKDLMDKDDILLKLLSSFSGRCGIIYCSTRISVDKLYSFLTGHERYSSAGRTKRIFRYHGGMTKQDRRSSQEAFIRSSDSVMIATCAFGMGIDKKDIRFVIHYQIPGSLEDYVQECGRASRDGRGGTCIMLYALQDINIRLSLIDAALPLDSRDHRLLADLLKYLSSDDPQGYMEKYFSSKKQVKTSFNRSRVEKYFRDDLYRYLIILRKRIADSKKIRHDKVMSTASLKSIATILPQDHFELLFADNLSLFQNIRYGRYFIFAVRIYLDFKEVNNSFFI